MDTAKSRIVNRATLKIFLLIGKLLPTGIFLISILGKNILVGGVLLSVYAQNDDDVVVSYRIYEQDKEIKDSKITLAVETELTVDEVVPSHLIDVRTESGIVTLSGSVDNFLARERAIKIAETIKGVRSVINNITINPSAHSDTQIVMAVKNALVLDPATDSYEIDVKVYKGIVTLYGIVESWTEKQLAGQVVKGIAGIKDIKNEIVVDYIKQRFDSEIEADIKGRLRTDIYVNENFIDVSVNNGKVTLHGTVGSAAEKSRAYNDAWVAGVTDVDTSGLEVKWWMRDYLRRKDVLADKSDEEMKKVIKDTFFYDPRLKSFDINVEVENEVVTLTGTVDNLKAKKAAAQDVRHTAGVWMIRNFIKVRPEKLPEDSAVTEDIYEALSRNPTIYRFDIDVEVINNKVYLYGTVDTFYEKQLVEDTVSCVPGVIDIVNKLGVNYQWPWKGDKEIEKDVKDQLYWNVFVDSKYVSVKVKNGVVNLFGTVDDREELLAAVKDAFEGGAKIVRSFLKIRKGKKDEKGYPKAHEPRYYYPEYFYDYYSSPYYILPRV
jgi:osmotically-inducible protein OsmY